MSRKPTPIERLILLATALLAAYQVGVGIEGLGSWVIAFYTVGFGVLLVSSLLLLIMGYEILGTPAVVLLATVLPLSLATGLVAEFIPVAMVAFILFDLSGLFVIALARRFASRSQATIILAVVHAVAGLIILILPLWLSLAGAAPAGFVWVSLGGALTGLTGLMLFFLRLSPPRLPVEKWIAAFPLVLLFSTAAFVAGFYLR